MTPTTIYIKGDPGFKPAVITKLGRAWIQSARDIGQDIVSFSLPENVQVDDFKASIGEGIISDHNVLFFDELPADVKSEGQYTYVPGSKFRMSVWR